MYSVPIVSVLLQSGQVYFINDGVSVNLFEWLTPLVSEMRCLMILYIFLIVNGSHDNTKTNNECQQKVLIIQNGIFQDNPICEFPLEYQYRFTFLI